MSEPKTVFGIFQNAADRVGLGKDFQAELPYIFPKDVQAQYRIAYIIAYKLKLAFKEQDDRELKALGVELSK